MFTIENSMIALFCNVTFFSNSMFLSPYKVYFILFDDTFYLIRKCYLMKQLFLLKTFIMRLTQQLFLLEKENFILTLQCLFLLKFVFSSLTEKNYFFSKFYLKRKVYPNNFSMFTSSKICFYAKNVSISTFCLEKKQFFFKFFVMNNNSFF